MRPLYREFSAQSEFDAQYNPSLLLPDPNAPGRHFVEAAERARSTLPCTLDVPYGPTLEETLDVFPATQANAPVFVFIHGGYWRALSSKTFSGVAFGPQARGITTVVINYALCPHVTIDEIVRQTRAALAWTLRNIRAYGGDSARVAIGGHSAGGHLTAMALQTPWAEDYGLPQDPFVAALPFSGLFDIEPLRYSYLQPAIQLDDGIIRRNSPAFTVRPCKTPLWITWGGAETSEFARQAEIYHQAWTAAGNVSELRAVPDANHFTVIAGLEDAKSEVCRWLAEKLRA
jgi:arylformamidase